MAPQKHITKNIKKVDAIVTGLILGGVVASIYGLSRDKKKEEVPSEEKAPENTLVKIAKLLVFGVPKEKPTMWQKVKRLFGGK